MNQNAVTIRVSNAEAATLAAYAKRTGLTKTAVLRECIRALEAPRARPARRQAGGPKP